MTALAKADIFSKAKACAPVAADPDAFRSAMRQLASGVCIVTLGAGEQRAGMTATSVASLSVDPPTLIVCVNRAASIYGALAGGARFGVSVLAAGQGEFADRFAGRTGHRGSERFGEGRWRQFPSGVHVLWDAAAAFECEVEDLVERHTHAIVIGRVRLAASGSNSGALVYWRGAYDHLGWTDEEVSRAVGLTPGKGAA